MSANAESKATTKEMALEEELGYLHRIFADDAAKPVDLAQLNAEDIGLSTDLFERAREVIKKHGIRIISHLSEERAISAHLAFRM